MRKDESFTFGCIGLISFLIVLVLSITLIFKIIIVPTDSNTATNGFIGLLATFIGIIVTFAIGFQIYNAIELKDEITKKMSAYDEKIQSIDDLKFQLEKSNLEKEVEILFIKAQNNFDQKLFLESLNCSLNCLDSRIRLEKHINSYTHGTFNNTLNNIKTYSYEFYFLDLICNKLLYATNNNNLNLIGFCVSDTKINGIIDLLNSFKGKINDNNVFDCAFTSLTTFL